MSEEHEDHEGNSPAAWTAVVIMLVAFSVGTVAFFFDYPVVVWIAALFVLLGLLTGVVLARMGYGVNLPADKANASAPETSKKTSVPDAAEKNGPGAR